MSFKVIVFISGCTSPTRSGRPVGQQSTSKGCHSFLLSEWNWTDAWRDCRLVPGKWRTEGTLLSILSSICTC